VKRLIDILCFSRSGKELGQEGGVDVGDKKFDWKVNLIQYI